MLFLFSLQVDIFSFGIVLWEILTGEEPYASMHCGAIIGMHAFKNYFQAKYYTPLQLVLLVLENSILLQNKYFDISQPHSLH